MTLTPSNQISDEKITEIIRAELTSNRRWLHRLVLVAALAMLGVILALWITEPRPLLPRLHASFATMTAIAVGWVFVLSNILLRKNCPTAADRIATGWMAVIGCTAFLVSSQVVTWLHGDVWARMTLAIVSGGLFVISVVNLRSAYRWQNHLRQRLIELNRRRLADDTDAIHREQHMAEAHTTATKGFQNRIVMVFDFDRTLAAGTIDALLDRLGVRDAQAWRRERLDPMVQDGWDEILAKGRLLMETAAEQGQEITRDLVHDVGRRIEGYPGLGEALEEVRRVGREASGGGEVLFYVLSSGFVDLMLPSPVSRLFSDVWGSSLEWSESGNLRGVKRSITHSEKSRYLLALAKGQNIQGANEPQDVHQHKPQSEWYVPLDQMLYAGDGASDIAAFSLMQDGGGIGIGVDHSGEEGQWQASAHLFEQVRVENLVPPDFREGSEMRKSLILAAGILGRLVALRGMARGE